MISILDSDDLEEYNSEYLENILNEKVEDYKEIKRRIKEYVEIVLPHLFKESAQLDAKFNKALSFSTHVITAVFTGSILCVYDRISTEQSLPNSHDMRLLCTALTLHDINKYWNEITNSRNKGNYYTLIQDYFKKVGASMELKISYLF